VNEVCITIWGKYRDRARFHFSQGKHLFDSNNGNIIYINGKEFIE
jgi:hypothetical protein